MFSVLPTWIASQSHWKPRYVDRVKAMGSVHNIYINVFETQCYQHFSELGCHIIVPECNPESKQVIHPCREMCHDLRKACSKITLPKSMVSMKIPHNSSDDTTVTLDNTSFDTFDCDYLPSLNGDIPCFYKPVSCEPPPVVKNATLVSTNYKQKDTYSVFDTVEYSCDEDFKLKGNKTVTCNYKGQWSTPPKCALKPINKSIVLFVVLPLLLILLMIIFVIGTCIYRIKRKIKNNALTRRKQYDAFVCYCYEGQDPDFAEKIIPQVLEEEHGLKLCIHRRDFKAGWDIKWNIMNAIRNSNSAIIIMSQDYINSLWCIDEFEDCYMENMKDPAFKLLVILMQPADTLDITNEYINSFLTKKTYLEREDPKLFKRIAGYLFQVKKPKDGKSSPEGAADEANDLLLRKIDDQKRADGGVQITIEEDKESIKLRKLSTQIERNMESVGSSDDEIDDQLLENTENYERKEPIVEFHIGDVGDTI